MGKAGDKVANHLKIWWKKHDRTNGLVIEHISPYQQKIIAPLFKDLGKKTLVLLS